MSLLNFYICTAKSQGDTDKMQCSGQSVGNVSVADLMRTLSSSMSELFDDKMKNLLTKYDLEEISHHMRELFTQIEELKSENQALKNEIQKMKTNHLKDNSRFEHVEEKLRRKNVIFQGVKEQKSKSLNEIVKTICNKNLKMNHPVAIISTRKLCDFKGNLTILAEMESEQCVREVLKRSKLLKGTSIYVDRDLSKEKQQQRKAMITLKKEILSKNKSLKVSVINEKLKVAKHWFTWNDKKELTCGNQNAKLVLQNLYKNVILDLDYNNLLSKSNRK